MHSQWHFRMLCCLPQTTSPFVCQCVMWFVFHKQRVIRRGRFKRLGIGISLCGNCQRKVLFFIWHPSVKRPSLSHKRLPTAGSHHPKPESSHGPIKPIQTQMSIQMRDREQQGNMWQKFKLYPDIHWRPGEATPSWQDQQRNHGGSLP
jgi:hypothetical protein